MVDIKFSDLKRTYGLYADEYEEAALRTLQSGWYILGTELNDFEERFASYVGKRHCIGVGCGQDALIIAVRALGIGVGDEVIVAGNTYIATVLGVTENGATPVFVDCNEWFQIDETLIETAITERTKAILVTNLYGQACNLAAIRRLCDKWKIYMLEDCAQSHGACWDNQPSGSYADISCFSFYPTKPLGAMGDAGACLTDDSLLAERMIMLRNYGSRKKYVNEICGINSRLDEVQAALLKVGLEHIEEMRAMRVSIASRYSDGIKNDGIILPKVRDGAENVWHIYPILCDRRNDLRDFLADKGIQTQIHYPIPPHKAQCYDGCGFAATDLPLTNRFAEQELSLPIYAGMPDDEVEAIITAINDFR